MITALRAQNFKAWRDTGHCRLAPITGLFGTNSSGKTSLTQLLLLLKQTAESTDRKRILNTGDSRSLVDLGTFYDLIHGHRTSELLTLDLAWRLPEELRVKDPTSDKPLFATRDLRFQTAIQQLEDRPVVRRFSYSFDGQEFGMSRRNVSGTKSEYDLIHSGYVALRRPGRAWPLPDPIKCYAFPDEATGYYQNTAFLSDLVLAFEELFQSVAYLGPLRQYPSRTYVWAGERPVDVGRQGELAVAALLAARAERLQVGIGKGKGRRYQPIEERIAWWLREMRLIHDFSLKPIAAHRKDYELRVRKNSTSPEVLITDVGFGVSQILPILVLCYYVADRSVLILEQPEIHLHPSVQAWLADVFIEVVREKNLQLILESHSEHLLRRLQRRIAEENFRSEDAALYFTTIDNGEARLEHLDVDIFGSISNWPDGFFGDEMGDLAAMTKATMNRRARPHR